MLVPWGFETYRDFSWGKGRGSGLRSVRDWNNSGASVEEHGREGTLRIGVLPDLRYSGVVHFGETMGLGWRVVGAENFVTVVWETLVSVKIHFRNIGVGGETTQGNDKTTRLRRRRIPGSFPVDKGEV